ncbi:hypothetical protein HRI_000569400 [Hibiscus trionum]|uniref:Endonuclease/exonuclease/phosphatase domain-containing protein n=1 Tax=Hibiscus trionum TaxID=183268 RepID=A0A9W7H1Z6_HIBTR|nr:hypothetical protein HRI_000569400 [Hibiscus trionum]
MDIKIFSWNVQGCGHRRFLTAAKQLLRDNKPDMVIFMEPRISGRKADSVISSLGFPNSHSVEAVGFAGGIWLAWYDTVKVEILLNHFQFIHCRVTAKGDGHSILATAVYASPRSSQRKILWPHLRRLATTIHSPWVLFGDFNATLATLERKGGGATSRPSKDFQAFVFDLGLRDMGYSGPEFTWTKGNTHVRLDRFICNSYWDETFPEASVEHLLRLRSDHRPILLSVGHIVRHSTPGPFRYFTGWQSHEDFERMVRDNWKASTSLSETLSNFAKAADVWNKTTFGYIGTKKKLLMARLRGIQISLASRPSRFLRTLEEELLIELEHLLDQEELLWRQKSRSDWIVEGDRNTRYFHRRATIRKQKHKITSLKLQNGTWCDDDAILQEEATRFYEHLFSRDTSPTDPFTSTVTYPAIHSDIMQRLHEVPSNDEIHDALRAMAPLKSPGWDDLHAEFFQRQWPIVGSSICGMIQTIFRGGNIEPSLNRTVLVLIPKKDNPEAFTDFRPIRLCTVLYKLVTKVIACRLKPLFPLLIGPNQSSFIAGRSIVDNIIINQEAVHSM